MHSGNSVRAGRLRPWGETSGAFLGLFMSGLITTGLGPALPSLMSHYQLDPRQAGLAISLRGLGLLASVPATGILAGLVPRKSLVLAGGLFIATGQLLSALAASWWIILGLSFLVGMGFGLLDVCLNTLIAESFGRRRGTGLNLLHMFYGVGALTGPFLAGAILSSSLGWRWVFGLGAFVGFLFTAYMGLQPLRGPQVRARGPGLSSLGRFAASPAFWLLALVMFAYSGVGTGYIGWMNTYLVRVFAMTTLGASVVLSFYSMGITGGRLLCSRIADRLGYGNTILLCSSGALLSAITASLAPSAAVAALSFGLTGFFFSGLFPTSLAFGTKLFPHSSEAVSSALLTGASAGAMLIPAIMAETVKSAGIRAGMVGSLGFLLVLFVAALLLVRIPEMRRHADGEM
ncbi:MAG: MFS transporter [Firmicutes bacterium]|nr:MFS transporter [Bacillota bacterium]